ncbi:adenylate kinase [Synechococcus sp. CS-1324]|uniref:adenylate kinase n=1 Tax=unclassified Synechococcus TaxID=2626047 RepID=UPI000DB7F303|nr:MULTISPECIES: adenylate kinase [unclassified Synechococcus]MCT0213764.1 adenylate kinase [Synechococcus sp. CS-1326]MCT0229290.1 adenylate kinase [Synechococcus sp. CS-1324]MCT0233794.1 adenylate kinase [Synechococcus sp. CS-1327]PZV06257.1 MAG: adenylate kinase [Cyanobium sp.]
MTHRILFLGPPGAGKGTQAERLAEQRQLLHLSTGELLRAEVQAGSDLGREAEAVMASGELVSDQLVLAIVRQRLETHHGGWLLDGFPRNLAQAESLNLLLEELDQPIQQVMLLELDDESLVERLLGRGRADDNEAVIRNRLEVYRQQTEPLIGFYRERKLLEPIEATGSIEEIAARILAAVV